MHDASAWDADAAVEELYAGHYRRLVRLAVLLVGDVETAEEVVQDSFVAMHGRWRRLREPDKGLAYLRQTVVNRSRSVLRHRASSRRGTSAPSAWDHPGADEAARRDGTTYAGLEALRRCRPAAEVLALRYYLDLSEARDRRDARNQPRSSEESRLAGRGIPTPPCWRTHHEPRD